MVVVSITLPSGLLKKFDNFVRIRGYYSRSEAFRDAVRSLISEVELLETQMERVVATVIVTSEYARKDVTVRLTRITCELDDIVIENLHRNIGDKHCLNIFIAEGTVQRIRNLVARIRGIRGIQEVKTVLMPM